MDADATVSNRLWLELLHAEVCWALADRGIEVLVIKGPSTSSWLYPEGERDSADVDLLLRPSQWDAAVSTLRERGFEPTYSGFREDETALHSLDLQRTNAQQGLHGLDLHHYFPGIEIDPEDAFEILWRDRLAADQAGVTVWFPSFEARALLIALHAARQPTVPKTLEDLRRVMSALSPEQIGGLGELARRLDARPPLRAGIETTLETAAYVEALGLTDVDVPAYWRLLSEGASPLSVEIVRARSLPARELIPQLRIWAFPSAARMRARYPDVGDSRLRLAGAHFRRWGTLVRRLPGAVSDARARSRAPR